MNPRQQEWQPRRPHLAGRLLSQLNRSLSAREDPDRRVVRLEQLVARIAQRRGEDSESVANLRLELADALEHVGNLEKSLAVRKQVVDTTEKMGGSRIVPDIEQQRSHIVHLEGLLGKNQPKARFEPKNTANNLRISSEEGPTVRKAVNSTSSTGTARITTVRSALRLRNPPDEDDA